MSGKIVLNKKQIEFVIEMTEIKEPQKAVQRFAAILIEEGVRASDMGMVIDRILQKRDRK